MQITNCPAAKLGAEIAANYRAHGTLDREFFAARAAGAATDEMQATHDALTRALDARLSEAEDEILAALPLSPTGALAQLGALVQLAEDIASYVPEDAERAGDAEDKERQLRTAANALRAFLVTLGADPAIVAHNLPDSVASPPNRPQAVS